MISKESHPQPQPTHGSDPMGNSSGKSGAVVRTNGPYYAEPPAGTLRRADCTAAADYYLRSHLGNLPRTHSTNFRLRIKGLVHRPLVLDLAQLKTRFACHAVVSRDPSGLGVIDNASWGGARLIEVLHAARADLDPKNHVVFDALDGRVRQGQRLGHRV